MKTLKKLAQRRLIKLADKTIGIDEVILTQESEVLEITDIRLGNQKKGGDVKMANTFS